MNKYTATITIDIAKQSQDPKPLKTALGAVKAAFKARKSRQILSYRVDIYQNGTSFLFFFAKDEAEAIAETKNMISRLKRRYK